MREFTYNYTDHLEVDGEYHISNTVVIYMAIDMKNKTRFFKRENHKMEEINRNTFYELKNIYYRQIENKHKNDSINPIISFFQNLSYKSRNAKELKKRAEEDRVFKETQAQSLKGIISFREEQRAFEEAGGLYPDEVIDADGKKVGFKVDILRNEQDQHIDRMRTEELERRFNLSNLNIRSSKLNLIKNGFKTLKENISNYAKQKIEALRNLKEELISKTIISTDEAKGK